MNQRQRKQRASKVRSHARERGLARFRRALARLWWAIAYEKGEWIWS